MKKTILTAMLFVAFSFLMVSGLSAQSVNSNFQATTPQSSNVHKSDYSTLENMPSFVESHLARFLLKTEMLAMQSELNATENESTMNSLQGKIKLYNDVDQLIYRQQMSVKDAIIEGIAKNSDSPADLGPVYSNSSAFDELVNLLKQ